MGERVPLMYAHRLAHLEALKHEALSLQPRPNDDDVQRFEALAAEFKSCPHTDAGIARMQELQEEAFALRDEIKAWSEAENERLEAQTLEDLIAFQLAAEAERERKRLASLPDPLHPDEFSRRMAFHDVNAVELAEGIDPIDLDLIDGDTAL